MHASIVSVCGIAWTALLVFCQSNQVPFVIVELANIAPAKCVARNLLDAVSKISGTVIFGEFDQYELFDVTCADCAMDSLLLS